MRALYIQITFLILYQSSLFANKNFEFERFTVEDGLVQNDINRIYQDHLGFMWFATRNGISRYDGIQFKNFIYNPDDSTSIAEGWCNDIFQDEKNRLFFLFGHNLLEYNYQTENFKEIKIDFKNGNGPQSVGGFNMFCDVRGYIWCLGAKIGILAIDENYNIIKQKREIGSAFCGLSDKKGNIWIGMRQTGLISYNFNTDSMYYYKHNPDDPNSLGNNDVQCIYVDTEGTFWVGTMDGGLNKYIEPEMHNMSGHFIRYLHSESNDNTISHNGVYSLLEDSKGNFWIGTLNGLCLFDRKANKFYRYFFDDRDNESINDNIIRAIFEDRTKNLWVGTRMGIGKLKNKRFRTLRYSSYQNSISANKIQCVYAEKNNIFLGSPIAIDIYNVEKNEFHVFSQKNEDGKNVSGPPLTIYREDDNLIWIGTWNGGLNLCNTREKAFKYYSFNEDEPEFMSRNRIFAICNDDNEHLWIGTWGGGLIHFNKNTGEHSYTFNNSDSILSGKLTSNFINCILKDDENNIWIGTNKGLNLIQNKNPYIFKHYLISPPFDKAQIFFLHQGGGPYLFIGTNQGLVRLNRETDSVIRITKNEGLPSDNVISMQEDDEQNIWIATNQGLAKCSNIYGGPKDFVIKLFDRKDGLQRQFLQGSTCKLDDGSLLFGGTNGISIFHPEKIIDDTIPPDIVLTDLLIRNKIVRIGEHINNQVPLEKSITKTQELILNYRNNAFTLKFAALHFKIPDRNGYAYKLKPYEDEWQYTDATKNEANYMNLPKGDYVFMVKASNSDGFWTEAQLLLKIKILPPWWNTWWFRITAVLFFISCFLSYNRYRVASLKRQKRKLEEKVSERTVELREANSQLEEKQEEILQQNEEISTVNNQLKIKNEEIETSRNQLEKAFNNISLISEFGQKLTATFDFEAINKIIYEYMNSLMDNAAFGIGIYNEKRKVIDFPYFMENGKLIPYFYKDISNEKSLSVRCFKNMEEIFINDLSVEYKKYLSELPELQTSELPSSVIHIPLTIENKAIGIVTVNSFKKNAYSDNDIANLRTLASYISIALDNSKAYRIIRSKNEQISGSIRYGQTIQQAMLPPKAQIDTYFENFILFRPKDIVSGDFYWFATINNPLNPQGLVSDNNKNFAQNPEGLVGDKLGNPQGLKKGFLFLAVVDCTGHGVPGAFMSMIGSRLLNDIVLERKIYSPAKILEQLNSLVRSSLRQDDTDNHDGMDLCLCRLQRSDDHWEVTYAGAKRPLIVYNTATNRIDEIPGTRRSIGGVASRRISTEFAESKLKISNNDMLYLSTDGLVDQCNPKKSKFSQKRLLKMIKKIHHYPMELQKLELEKEIDLFQDGFEQRDDITLLGLKMK